MEDRRARSRFRKWNSPYAPPLPSRLCRVITGRGQAGGEGNEEGIKMKKKSSEMWVGVFVVIGILLLALLTMKVEKFPIGKKRGYLVNILFDSAAGLDRRAEVRVDGVSVGNVEKVILEKGRAKVTFRVPPHVVLYKDSKAYFTSKGFLG